MKTIAYYLRNSTDSQDYQYQLENLDKKFNRLKNFNKIVYSEKLSGFKSEKDRPQMKQLLKDVDEERINEIWVNDITRLSRDAINMQIIVKHCQEKGVNIYFDEQNLNTLDKNGNADFTTTLLINILGQFAEANAKNFISKGKQGKITKAKQGRYVGGLLPLGYTYKMESKNKEIIINEKEKKIVEYLFDSYVIQNKSLSQIANEFNNIKKINVDYNNKFDSLKTSIVHMWRGSTIREIIRCKWYALGIGNFGGEEFTIKNELKFINLDLFNKAQEKLSLNINNVKPHKYSYILHNLVYCDCGAKMYTRANNTRQTYQCNTIKRRENDKSLNCFLGKQIQIEQIENAIWLMVKNKLNDFKIEIAKKANKENVIKEKIDKNIMLVRSISDNTIEDLKKQRQRTIDTFNKFGGNSIKLETDINSIDNNIKKEEKNIAKLQSEIKMLEISVKNLDIAEEIKKSIENIEADKNLMKYYLENLIKQIIVLGIKSKSTNVYKIIWNENINNNTDTYLIHNSRLYQKPKYYYINEIDKVSVITWDRVLKAFKILDIEKKKRFKVEVNEIINYMDSFYDEEFDELEPEVSIMRYSKENSIFNIIEGGQSKLKIISPFK